MGKLLSERGAGQRRSAVTLNEQRRMVEADIQTEETVLASVLELLHKQSPFSEWPALCQRSLRAALTGEKEGVEAYKARVLCRHLFKTHHCPLPLLPLSALSPLELRIAERLRADLPTQAYFGSGIKIVEIERSVLLRMGFSSLEAEKIIDPIAEPGQ